MNRSLCISVMAGALAAGCASDPYNAGGRGSGGYSAMSNTAIGAPGAMPPLKAGQPAAAQPPAYPAQQPGGFHPPASPPAYAPPPPAYNPPAYAPPPQPYNPGVYPPYPAQPAYPPPDSRPGYY